MSTIFQTPEWEKFKLATGYSKSFRVENILVLKKDLPLGRSMLYSPMIQSCQLKAVSCQNYWNKIQEIAEIENAIFYRLEMDVPKSYPSRLGPLRPSRSEASGQAEADQLKAGSWKLKKSFEEMQPEHTLVINITKTEEEILGEMKPKGRYNIKVAEKSGVIIRRSDSVDNFYSLYATMANRQKITFRNKQYFQKLVDVMREKGYCEVFEGYITDLGRRSNTDNNHTQSHPDSSADGEGSRDSSLPQNDNKKDICLAVAIISYYEDQAIYLFGGSSDEMRNVMAPYKLQWEAILEAKRRGCKTYDFFGIAPDDNPKHAWAGVTRFKKQFGGEEVTILGSYDKVYKQAEYQVFKIAEKLRRH